MDIFFGSIIHFFQAVHFFHIFERGRGFSFGLPTPSLPESWSPPPSSGKGPKGFSPCLLSFSMRCMQLGTHIEGGLPVHWSQDSQDLMVPTATHRARNKANRSLGSLVEFPPRGVGRSRAVQVWTEETLPTPPPTLMYHPEHH